ncbi:MAG: hypothetical protein ACRD0G_04590 [Acidimicrobiales bacterium]
MTVTPEQIVAACRDAHVRLVRFLYCDNGGIVRGKIVPSTGWPSGFAPASA